MIASGSGSLNELSLNHVAHSGDIVAGDLLISSGLGNIFPAGYPVATITNIVRDEGKPFASISALPSAQLDRLKYLLLLWPAETAPAEALSPNDELSGAEQ
jgi:rod shape-determining protein MreC